MGQLYDDKIIKNSWFCKLLIALATALTIVILILLLVEFLIPEVLDLNIVLVALIIVSITLIIGFVLAILFKTLKN